MNDAIERIEVIENSLRCFYWGWSALIPLFGMPALIIALLRFRHVSPKAWNPARRHAIAGLCLATGGAILSVLEYFVICAAIVNVLS